MFLSLLFAAQAALAQDAGQSHFSVAPEKIEETAYKPWSADMTVELRATSDKRDRPQNKNRQSIYEVAAGGSYRFDKTLKVKAELSVEQINDESTFYVKQAFVEWNTLKHHVEVIAGQQFLPVGLYQPRENWFSYNPPFMDKLVGFAKPIDLGIVARIHAFEKPWLFAEGGVFSGQLVREQDARLGEPERAPRILSLKSHSEYHDVFLSYWEHDLAFYDPLRAYGAGGEIKTPEWKSLKGSFLAEFWQMEQIQANGPDERTNAYMLVGQVDFWKLSAGYRFSEAFGRLVTATGANGLPREVSRLAFLEVELAPMLKLRGERVIDEQSVVLRDEWAGRLLLDWEL